jgi:GTP-binding protein
MSLPTVVIAGRPNVGKSTLMNRIYGSREAIVEERPGVTRDRKSVEAEWLGRHFTVVDTGGWMVADADHIDGKVARQAEEGIAEADLVLFVVDGTVGATDADAQVAEVLRRTGVPVLLVANKVDDAKHESGIWDLMSLGMGEPFPISALHSRGTGDLLDAVIERFDEADMAAENIAANTGEEDMLAISIVGRPNVGKSTLFNQLVGDERAVVHDMPGTTRDSVDTLIETEFGTIKLVDTAGMRRKARIEDDTEYYSMIRALATVDYCDVALLVIDATDGITHQDQRLAERIDGAGCPVVIVLNKWELPTSEDRREVEYQIEQKMHFLANAPILKISALTGKGVKRLLPTLQEVIGDYSTRIPTREVNQVLRKAQALHRAPDGARVLYGLQGATNPPTFTFFANHKLHPTYLRYLERSLREEFKLGSTPIKIRVRRRSE